MGNLFHTFDCIDKQYNFYAFSSMCCIEVIDLLHFLQIIYYGNIRKKSASPDMNCHVFGISFQNHSEAFTSKGAHGVARSVAISWLFF